MGNLSKEEAVIEETAADKGVLSDIDSYGVNDFDDNDQSKIEQSDQSRGQSVKRVLSAEEIAENSQKVAATVVGLLETAITIWQPVVEYDDGTREQAVAKLAPVFAKHGGAMPPWLAAWQEEIKAVLFFGGVGLSTYYQIKAASDTPSVDEEEKKGNG